MTRIEERCWPLAIALAAGAQSLEDQRAFLAMWNGWLGRGTSFAVLRLFVDTEALAHPEGGARLAKQWMQDNAARIRQSVMGLASIVPASAYEKMSRMDIEKAFGVPGGVFRDEDGALTWLAGQVFEPRGVEFDRASVEEVLHSLMAGLA
jgi:hypothetical protein